MEWEYDYAGWAVYIEVNSGAGYLSPIALRPRELPRAQVTTSTYSIVSITQDCTGYTHGLELRGPESGPE